MFSKTFATAAVAAAAICGASAAQDWTLNPTYGSGSLNAGFMPDPQSISVTAGGSVDASGVGCVGMVANAPDFRLHWGGGEVTIGVESEGDTSLLINGPDGTWYCSDDANGLNPALRVSDAGQYDIWVGHLSGPTAATLYATEY